jgi:hypothetical protein
MNAAPAAETERPVMMKRSAVLLLLFSALLSLLACQTDKKEDKPLRARAAARLKLSLIEALPPHEAAEFPVAGGVPPERGKLALVTESELEEALQSVSAWGSEPLDLPEMVTVHANIGRSDMMSPAVYGPPGAAPPKEGVRWTAWPQINEQTGAISVRSQVRMTESLGLADPHTPRPAGVKPEFKAHVIEVEINIELSRGESAVFCAGTSSQGHPVWGILRAEYLPPGSVDEHPIKLKMKPD